MCGFAGFVSVDRDAFIDNSLLQAMLDTLVHRGPDDEGLWSEAPFALGFRRLSIIDVSGGHQPLFNETGDVAVVSNGEIYNYRELRDGLIQRGHHLRTGSDMETLAHLYEEKGADMVHDLVGMFAFAIADRRDPARPRLLLARDRVGIKPLYWGETPTGLAFGSEAKALLATGLFAREMRPEALLDYLIQGYGLGAESAWKGIHRLPPGHVLEWTQEEGARTRRYWDLPTDGLRGPAKNEEVLELFDRVVRDRLVSDVPLGAFLSGGVDSTAVVGSMAEALDERVVACTVGFHERSHDELAQARETAKALNAVHHTEVLEPDPRLAVDVLPWHFDEPLADPSTVPTYLVSEVARRHVTVAISGDGGDEVFAGYRRYVHDLAENRVRQSIGAPGRRIAGALGSLYPKLDWAPRVFRAKTFLSNLARDPAAAYFDSVSQLSRVGAERLLAPDVRAALRAYDPLDHFRDLYDRPRAVDSLYRAQYADFHTNLPDRILAKVDRASMAVSLEVRVPILDHRFVERFVHLPASEKVNANRGKHRLREALRPRLSASVLDGTKRGFDTPLKTWIRGPLSDIVHDTIETIPEDWFDRSALRTLEQEHASGLHDHSRSLWGLLVLEHWRRRHEVSGLASV
ncbi:MAG: asparagine synthase (glutamine-hydrolyzing) [Planctomycetota bacterium]|jgi:asparagine synthase (glutamine-hydrolysing)